MQKEIYILVLAKNGERFVFLYDISSTDLLLEELQNLANCQESPLNGFDVAILTGKMREQVAGQSKMPRIVNK